jgi:hypothetical protein
MNFIYVYKKISLPTISISFQNIREHGLNSKRKGCWNCTFTVYISGFFSVCKLGEIYHHGFRNFFYIPPAFAVGFCYKVRNSCLLVQEEGRNQCKCIIVAESCQNDQNRAESNQLTAVGVGGGRVMLGSQSTDT